MDFALTDTQRDLRDAARRYLADRYPWSRVAELAARAEYDMAAWPELDRQGWFDRGLGEVERALLAEESGRALHPVPWWSAMGLALPAYHSAGAALPGPATLADGRGSCRARRDSGGWRVSGRVDAVVDLYTAVELVVAVDTDAGTALLALPRTADGPDLPGDTGVDSLRPSGRLELSGVQARMLVEPPAAEAVLALAARRCTLLLAAEAVGVAERALDLAVTHAKVRTQFGRPIGSFQAVSHQLADCYADVELARSLTYWAAATLAGAHPDGTHPDATYPDGTEASEALACAAHAAPQAAIQSCERAMQVHGGTGVTWDFPLHRWYRRALWLSSYRPGRVSPITTLADLLLGPVAG